MPGVQVDMQKVKLEVIKPWITRAWPVPPATRAHMWCCQDSKTHVPVMPPLSLTRNDAGRVTELLGFEDEVVIEYVFGQLEETRVRRCTVYRPSCGGRHYRAGAVSTLSPAHVLVRHQFPQAKQVQINLTGFLERKTGQFMQELWTMLLSAQSNIGGVPTAILDAKKREILAKKVTPLVTDIPTTTRCCSASSPRLHIH